VNDLGVCIIICIWICQVLLSYIAVPLIAIVRNYSFLDTSDRKIAHIINLWLNYKLRGDEFLWTVNLQLDCRMWIHNIFSFYLTLEHSFFGVFSFCGDNDIDINARKMISHERIAYILQVVDREFSSLASFQWISSTLVFQQWDISSPHNLLATSHTRDANSNMKSHCSTSLPRFKTPLLINWNNALYFNVMQWSHCICVNHTYACINRLL